MRKRSYDPWCASSQHDHFSRILGQISPDADALNHYINLELTKPRKHFRQSRRQVQDSKSIIFCLHYWKESSWVSTSRFFLKNMSRTYVREVHNSCDTSVQSHSNIWSFLATFYQGYRHRNIFLSKFVMFLLLLFAWNGNARKWCRRGWQCKGNVDQIKSPLDGVYNAINQH